MRPKWALLLQANSCQLLFSALSVYYGTQYNDLTGAFANLVELGATDKEAESMVVGVQGSVESLDVFCERSAWKTSTRS